VAVGQVLQVRPARLAAVGATRSLPAGNQGFVMVAGQAVTSRALLVA
jgi:hypothetical protein